MYKLMHILILSYGELFVLWEHESHLDSQNRKKKLILIKQIP